MAPPLRVAGRSIEFADVGVFLKGTLFIAGVIAAAALAALARRDVAETRARLAAERLIAPGRQGPIEYAVWGEGPPVLVVHGAGGGFDQGRLIADALGPEGFRWIAPSRFGYLGSPLPPDASTAAQADAFADLLDHLNVERAHVLAFSGGVPPALRFAVRHPARANSLVLLSAAPFTPYSPVEETRPIPTWLYQAVFGEDTIFWILMKIAPGVLERAFDARPDLKRSLSAREQAFVADLAAAFLPASARVAGIRNEVAAIDPAARYDLEAIAAPSLVIHARDDRINPFNVGETIARRVPDAAFLPLETGGHLLLGRHDVVRARIRSFLEEDTSGGEGPDQPDRRR